jgi:excisionase family DNA binding protein
MRDAEYAAALAIGLAKRRGLSELGPDELLLGCLQAVSQFGIAQVGPWTFDLEEFGVDWLAQPDRAGPKVAYSQRAVDLFDLAARIARADGPGTIRVDHLLAAFAAECDGLMGGWKRDRGITGAAWRAAVAQLWAPLPGRGSADGADEGGGTAASAIRDYLTPEEAAEALSIHVQTLRAYVRAGKLPAVRLAGERAIRIRRGDLETVLEPLVPQA